MKVTYGTPITIELTKEDLHELITEEEIDELQVKIMVDSDNYMEPTTMFSCVIGITKEYLKSLESGNSITIDTVTLKLK